MTKLPKTTPSTTQRPRHVSTSNKTNAYLSHHDYKNKPKAVLGRNSSFTPLNELHRLGPFKYSTREWNRSNPKKRAQSAHLLSKWKREEMMNLNKASIDPNVKDNATTTMDIKSNITKTYQRNLSHCVYGKITLSWDKKPKWKLQNEYEIKLQHLAQKKVRQLWRARNVPDYNPIPSYDKLISSTLKTKLSSPKKSNNHGYILKNPFKDKKKKYLRPGPIFSKIHIESNNLDNKCIVKKGQQIIIDIDTRLRTHRPKVILWPSEFYKEWNLKSKSKADKTRKRPKTSRSTKIISRSKNSKYSMNFTPTFSNSYLYRHSHGLPRQYDVEISVIEKAIGSKKWRAIFHVDSNRFINGIVPFIVTTKVMKTTKFKKTKDEFVTNMTTDNSYVILLSKKRKRHKSKSKTKRKEIPSMMKGKLETNQNDIDNSEQELIQMIKNELRLRYPDLVFNDI